VIALITLCNASPATAALVSHWRAENNTSDSVGANHGNAVGTVQYAQGAVGQAFHLPDAGHIDVPNPVAGGLQSVNAFTIAGFVRIDNQDPPPEGGPGSIVQLGTPDFDNGFLLDLGGPGTVAFAVFTTARPNPHVLVSQAFGAGETHHIAATFDAISHSMILYRDGERVAGLINQPLITEMVADPDAQFVIGKNIYIGGTFDGLIDDLRFYNEALGDAQIRELAAVPEPGTLVFSLLAGLFLIGIAWKGGFSFPGMVGRHACK
jgi:hypothetical protein